MWRSHVQNHVYAISFRPLQTSFAAARFVALVRAQGSHSYPIRHAKHIQDPISVKRDPPVHHEYLLTRGIQVKDRCFHVVEQTLHLLA
jgi:hypothetical protein